MTKEINPVRISLTHKKFEIEGNIIGFDEFFNLTVKNAVKIDGAQRTELKTIILRGENVAVVRTTD